MEKLPIFDRQSLNQYKQQRFWQIIFPILMFSLLIITAGGFMISAGVVYHRVWADISIIWLVIPLLMLSLFLIVILVGLIYGMTRLSRIIPIYSLRVQNFFSRIELGTRKIADSSMRPFFWLHNIKSKIHSFMDSIKS